ncbi:CPBP family intramembrane glutamic endopeptidase [Bifidobacterium mongoliense]|uniref:Metal-dependent membrane protease n=1 Tax=Bifidobacterium mongoliense TaxID=518643 RepID=A0A423UC17_9BIFI|nr:CPBP family intramembrane glutamic endopeptidase [Bifidobacterium mongoliense]ROT86245.1 metal-dependent membrane protease [Bifidobacterium mongoliense]
MAKQIRSWLHEVTDEVTDVFGRELNIDSTGISARNVEGWQPRAASWTAIVAVFVIGWAQGTCIALRIALGYEQAPAIRTTSSISDLVLSILQDGAIAAVAAVLIWAFRQYSGARPVRASSRANLKTFFLAIDAMALGWLAQGIVAQALTGMFGIPSYKPGPEQTTDLLTHILTIAEAAMAGPSEELALMALVVVALHATGYNRWVIVVVAILVRIPFHLYYGWSAIALFVWVVLTILLYWRTGAIVGIVLAHTVWDVLFYLPYFISFVIKVVLVGIGFVVVCHRTGQPESKYKVRQCQRRDGNH